MSNNNLYGQEWNYSNDDYYVNNMQYDGQYRNPQSLRFSPEHSESDTGYDVYVMQYFFDYF